MLRLAIRNVTARFGRIVLTALAIIVSTAFLSGTFMFRDTLEGTFNAIFAKSYEKVDAYVQSANTVETAFGFEVRDKVPVDAVQVAAHVRGVADAQALIQGDAVVIGKNAKPIGRTSRATSGGTINTGDLSVWKIVAGRSPTGPNEVVLDGGSDRHGLARTQWPGKTGARQCCASGSGAHPAAGAGGARLNLRDLTRRARLQPHCPT